MGCFYCCCCTLLVLINIVYMLIGLVLAVIGILFNVAQSWISSFVKPLIEGEMKKLGSDSGGGTVDVQQAIDYIFKNMTSISVALIVVGVILFVLSILGMCSVCCKSKTAIIVYLSILSLILVIQIIAVIIFAAKPEIIQQGLTSILQSMIKNYRGIFDTNIESFLINLLGIMYNCCGANGYKDFDNSPNFNRTISGTFTYEGQQHQYNVQLQYPISCCQFNNFKIVDIDGCVQRGVSNNKDTGCTQKMFNEMNKYIIMVYQVIGGIIGFQALILLAAIICLVSLKQESNVKPV